MAKTPPKQYEVEENMTPSPDQHVAVWIRVTELLRKGAPHRMPFCERIVEDNPMMPREASNSSWVAEPSPSNTKLK